MENIKVIREDELGVVVAAKKTRCPKCKYYQKSFEWCMKNCKCSVSERYLTEEEEKEYYSLKKNRL